jgi:transcriptional regulator with XRE-family HTH domain
MTDAEQPAWDGRVGTAGGVAFGKGLAALAAEREVTHERLAEAVGLRPEAFAAVLAGDQRVGISALAHLAQTLRTRPIEFLQKTAILSLEVYAFGLDPLYFLPDGQVRYDARIYMREINPRHRVPEGDMTKRNPALAALAQDEVLDALGKIEVELAYLLRAAVQHTGGTL